MGISMAAKRPPEIRIRCHDKEILGWISSQPRMGRNQALINVIRRGMGVSDEGLDSLKELLDTFADQIAELKNFKVMSIRNVDALFDKSDDMQNATLSLHERLETVESLLAHKLEGQGGVNDDTTSNTDSEAD